MSIPASNIVQILPGVVSAGGNPLSLNGVILDTNAAVPSGSVLQFVSAAAVASYFGSSSLQASLASIYFNGFDNSTQKPGLLYFAPYASSARSAQILGGSLESVTLATLQGWTGTLAITIAGSTQTSSSIELSAATSFSNAAALIQAAFTGPAFVVNYNSQRHQFVITSSATGATETIAYATGTLAANLKLATGTGAMLSPGIDADTATTAMTNVLANTRNWAAFTTAFEPDTAGHLDFAAWTNAQNNLYAYIAWDTDVLAVQANQPTTFGAQVKALNYNGTCAISGDASLATINGTTNTTQCRNVAAFVLGAIASVDFAATNGRITFAFRSQSGLAATVADETKAANLIGNGYNYYGAYATAAQPFVFFYPGQVSGIFEWLDSFINQIKLNADFQLSGMELLTVVNSIAYNQAGYTLVKQALADDINTAINFGTIRQGIQLSSLQAAQVNAAAGLKIDDVLSTRGWYLQVKDPGATVRGNRGTPVCNFWYTDGQAVQRIVLNSINVQ